MDSHQQFKQQLAGVMMFKTDIAMLSIGQVLDCKRALLVEIFGSVEVAEKWFIQQGCEFRDGPDLCSYRKVRAIVH